MGLPGAGRRSRCSSTTSWRCIGQLGDWHGRDHSAFAGHAELGYTLDLPWSPRLVGQFDYASGTADPSGDESHTFVFLFGARRLEGKGRTSGPSPMVLR